VKPSPDNDISYQVVRSRRATADIVVERDGSIVVRAPETVPDKRIEDIVEAKRFWIYKTLAEWRELNASRVTREFRNGEGFLYLGRSYRLSLATDQEESLMLKSGRFYMRSDLVDGGNTKGAKDAFRTFYMTRGLAWLQKRINYFAPKVGVTPKQTHVRSLGNRWASCSPTGNLAFHWKTMMAPPSVIDYIVVHELCHFHHLDHTDAFWNEVDKVLPNYRERQEWLRTNGAAMDL